MTWEKTELYQAISDCDRLILLADMHNSAERLDHRQDERRLERYSNRRLSVVALRRRLEAIYKSLYGEEPWADVPF